MAFEIHPRLAAGGIDIGRSGGCALLLKNNALFPWFILIPEVEGIAELHLLEATGYDEVMAVQRRVCEFLWAYFRPEKINIGCIGNQVPQLHIHIVGRSSGDPAWPGTVWGFDGKQPYTNGQSETIRSAARAFFELDAKE